MPMETSLLWPSREASADVWEVPEAVWTDLEGERWSRLLWGAHATGAGATLRRLPLAPAVTRHRQAVCADLLADPALRHGLATAIPAIREVAGGELRAFERDTPRVIVIAKRLRELERYARVVGALNDCLGAARPASAALAALSGELDRLVRSAEFHALQGALPACLAAADSVRSVRLAINLSPLLVPQSAVVTEVSAEPVGARHGLLAHILGSDQGARGMARLGLRTPLDWTQGEPLAREVRGLLEAALAPVERALAQFRQVRCQEVVPLADELAFLVGACQHAANAGQRGLAWCLPEVSERDWHVRAAHYPPLAADLAAARAGALPVVNDIHFAAEGGLWILTGPNRGGKTTFVRTVGIIQLLGQSGLPIPGQAGCIRPRPAVLTHFPAEEQGTTGRGRLDEEAARLADLLAASRPGALLLLNETFSGTSAAEGFALAWDVVRGMRALGLDLVYATHLHELAARCDALMATGPGRGAVGSLVAATREGAPTYAVAPGLPEGPSYFASEIARRHGLTLAQLLAAQRSGRA